MLHSLKRINLDFTYKSVFGKDIVENVNVLALDTDHAKRFLDKISKEKNMKIGISKTTCDGIQSFVDPASLLEIGAGLPLKSEEIKNLSDNFCNHSTLIEKMQEKIYKKNKNNIHNSITDSDFITGYEAAYNDMIKIIKDLE